MSKETPNIVICIDNNFIEQAKVTVTSISLNRNGMFNLFVITNKEFKQKELKKLTSNLKNLNQLKFIVTEFKGYGAGTKWLDHISEASFYRLHIPSYLGYLDKIVYLDCDLVVNTDIQEIFDVDVSEKYIAGVKELAWVHLWRVLSLGKKNFKYLKDIKITNYINSGALVMNPKALNKENYDEKLDMFISKYEKFHFADQDILNYTYPNKKLISPEWNHTVGRITMRFGLVKKHYIIHYATKLKPWKEGRWNKFCIRLLFGKKRANMWSHYSREMQKLEGKEN